MKILAIEFSSPLRSAAVLEGGEGPGRVLGGAQSVFGDADRQSSDALRLVDEALGAAGVEREQIEGLAIGLGPGSYTGIRGAISLAQGWQLATGIKLFGISTVECLAAQALAEGVTGKVEIVIDAQRQEFYIAEYELGGGQWREVTALRLASIEEVRQREGAGGLLAGPEVRNWFPAGRVLLPQAARLGQIAAGRSPVAGGEELEPVYLRETRFVKAPPPRVWPLV